jgi:nucleotidyltransferase/DNA polymerase involved in DNA repair
MWTEPILHVDMDAFFVEVERLRRPDLVGVPVAVGGLGPRAVVAAASYEARVFGVHSAIPMTRARRLCPDLIVVPADHHEYRRMSEQVFEIFRSYTPLVEGLSLDEAFLDVSGLRRHHPGPEAVAADLRARIATELKLPASVGIAATKFVAKLASQAAKPDGVVHVHLDDQLEFIHALPLRALWGVGEATMAALETLGVETVGDIAVLPVSALERRVGAAHGRHLADLADGRDPRRVEPDTEAKSVSVEETYDTDLVGKAAVQTELLAHAETLASRLRRSGLAGRTVTVKIRYADFTTVTRSETHSTPTDVGRDLHRAAVRLVDRVDLAAPVRLVGLSASSLEPADTPRQLEVEEGDGWNRVAEAVEAVRLRFGDESVEPARLLGRRGRQR